MLRGAHANNLHGLDVEIPLGMLVAITGVSGSGKSTLVHQVLYRAVARALGQSDGADPSGVFKSLTGVERLNDVVLVDQTPIGRTPRSNPITYIKGFDLVRELFAVAAGCQTALAYAGAFFFQRARRPLQHLRGRRHGDRGDAVPGRRGVALRGLQRHALPGQDSAMSSTRARIFTTCCR